MVNDVDICEYELSLPLEIFVRIESFFHVVIKLAFSHRDHLKFHSSEYSDIILKCGMMFLLKTLLLFKHPLIRTKVMYCKCVKVLSYHNFIKTLSFPDVDGKERIINYLDAVAEEVPTKEVVPLVLIGGTAQTISTWSPHIKYLAKHRRLIIPELRCQGIITNLESQFGTIPQHVHDLSIFFDKLSISQADIVGFSFGGRVGLAFAAHKPNRIRKLSVMGVPLRRPQEGAITTISLTYYR